MFFEAEHLEKRRDVKLKSLPPIPPTGWTAPRFFPNLSGNVRVISFDVETWEPDFDNGPGWGRGKGHIVGFSLAPIGT